MGTRRYRKRHRSNLVFPKSGRHALEILSQKGIPVPKLGRRPAKGERIPAGSRLWKHGLTPEESLISKAPEGSRPERLIFGWLKRHDIPFDFQVPLMGGRVQGGAIVDFLLYTGVRPIIIRVMSYWHHQIGTQIKDEVQLKALQDLGYDVRDVWEHDVNTEDRVHFTMMDLIFGPPKRTAISEPRAPDYGDTVITVAG